MSKQTRFQQTCPRKLDKYPDKPCQFALQSLEAVRNGQPENISCPFYINSLESNFCFHSYMEDESPVEGQDSIRKIGQLLIMSEKEVNSHLKTGLEKLNNTEEDVQLFAEILGEQSQYFDESIYETDLWIEEVTGKQLVDISLESVSPGKPGRKKKDVIKTPKGFSGGGAIHKSGKRIQLTNLSAKWKDHVKEFNKGDTPIRFSKNTMGEEKEKKDEKETD